jgi:chromate transporter
MTSELAADTPSSITSKQSVWVVFLAFLRLGLTSFGGPVAHLGYFREDFVVRRRWIDEHAYADLVALCQFLPGPASSQVGIGIGLAKAGLPGAVAAWTAFTMPSAIALCLFGYGVITFEDAIPPGVLGGLKVAAVAVVAQAVWGMAGSLCPDRTRATMALVAAMVLIVVPTPLTQLLVIIVGGLVGWFWLQASVPQASASMGIRVNRRLAWLALIIFAGLLALLPVVAADSSSQTITLIDSFYRSGALVFGGGHVVLPLLQAEVVPNGWVSADHFMAGYGAAQAVPGPLFTFAAFLGSVMSIEPSGWVGALVCLLAIFTSSFLLVIGVLPFWDSLRQIPSIRRALTGVNAAVVGLLLAALYDPVWTSAINSGKDVALALAAYVLLALWKVPAWLVVILAGAGGWGLSVAGSI